ncbi:MAG: extracellular solute-binding protein [Candidatus Omnitrophica bacterium]|nr:extracellular solute-binding protein [Candidatus Omnitrophota bacterium]
MALHNRLIRPFRVFACLFFLSLIFATDISADDKAAGEGPVVLNFWELSVQEELMRVLIGKFEEENPGIEVRLQLLSWDSGFDKIITSIAAGNAPDVCELGTTWVPKFSHSGVLRDITDEVRDIRGEYFLWEPTLYQGRVYGAPWLAGTRVMIYNRDLFSQAGLDRDDPPKTWNELLEAVHRIDELGPETYGFGIFAGEGDSVWQEFLPFAWGNGGEVLNKNHTASRLAERETIEALEYYRRLKEFSLVDRQAQVNQLFADGKIGIQISGPWNFTMIPRQNPDLNFGVALLPRPDKPGGVGAAFAGGEILTILSNSKHPAEAFKLIQFLIRGDNAIEITKLQQNIVPTHKNIIQHPYFQTHPNQRTFFKQLETAVAPPSHPDWVEIQEHVTRAVEEVIFRDRKPQEALDDASAKVNAILEREEDKVTMSDALITASILLPIFLFIAFKLLTLRKGKTREQRFIFKRDYASFLFILPWLLVFLLFGLYPLLFSVIISFTKYNLLTAHLSFTGLGNFVSVLIDPEFHNALWHTFFFALGTIPFTIFFALASAVLINRQVPFKQLYQAGLFLPVSTSVIVIATIFSYLYSPEGLITQAGNALLDRFSLPHPDSSWLNDVHWALPSIMAMNVWSSFGYYMVLFLAGLQTIPHEFYEAADIDGAGEWQKFWHITLPQLKPIMLFVMVINTIHSFQVFPEIFAMTKGGPLGSTTTVVYHLYEIGFHRFEMGQASAVAYILFMIIMIFSLLQMRVFRFGETQAE